jgi:hypothetical protein
MSPLSQISYPELNPKEQEAYNILKFSAVLADYGFLLREESHDPQVDFIAVHIHSKVRVKVQIMGRLGFVKKCLGRDIYIAFPVEDGGGRHWYLGPHDELFKLVLGRETTKDIEKTRCWIEDGNWNFHPLPQDIPQLIEPYKIGTEAAPL